MGLKLGLIVVGLIVVLQLAAAHQDYKVQADELETSMRAQPRMENFLSALKRTSRRALGFLTRLLISIPFGKIALGSGALLGIFFLFVRLLIVLGPILILGAMTRESTEPTDLIRMLIEFYNQMIVALDQQQQASPGQAYSA